ncbi:undecaprenyl-diphosphate phosphatase, partial [archaeon]|nr:undecaprenyl-diphosphate phosphatase [archaeon]
MISIWVFIVLGIAQGVLEWLPVSSEGQIILLGTLFGIENSNLILSIAFWLHLGTLISVIIYYRQEWKTVLNIQDKDGDFLRKFIIITSIFTGIVGLPIKYLLTNSLNNDDNTVFATEFTMTNDDIPTGDNSLIDITFTINETDADYINPSADSYVSIRDVTYDDALVFDTYIISEDQT